MKNKNLKRFASLMLSLMVLTVFTLAVTLEVNAATETKTFYVMTKSTDKIVQDGKTTHKGTTTYTYDKNGLGKTTVTDYEKTVFKRNKTGYLTSVKRYDPSGKLFKIEKYSKNKVKYYDVHGKDKALNATRTDKVYKNGKLKSYIFENVGGDYISNYYFDKKGNPTKSKVVDPIRITVTKYDKYGMPISETAKLKDRSANQVITSKYKYNKNGTAASAKIVSVTDFSGGKDQQGGYTVTATRKTTYTYKYDKHGNKTRMVLTTKLKTVTEGPDSRYETSNSTITQTYTYKYKAVKVKKAFWKFFDA